MSIVDSPSSNVVPDRNNWQKSFEFLSRVCLLRGEGGQGKSAKNCLFPDKSLLFQIVPTKSWWLATKQGYESIATYKLPFSMLNFALMQTFALGSMHSGLKGQNIVYLSFHYKITRNDKSKKYCCTVVISIIYLLVFLF